MKLVKKIGLLNLIFVLISVNSAHAVDHNNIDAGHPLSFDDAESIGLGEQSLEVGTSLIVPSDGNVGGEFDFEYLYGFALNSHLMINIEPSVGGRMDTDDTDFDIGNVSVGVFHNFNREYDNTPALAVRADAAFPTGNNSQGIDFRLRGIASKTVGQYNRLHFNLDLNLKTEADNGNRSVIPGLIVGYSRPIGYPKRFDRTFLAQLGVRASEDGDGGAILLTGVGLRQQIGYQSVFDIGIESNIVTNGGEQSDFRLNVGYSLSF